MSCFDSTRTAACSAKSRSANDRRSRPGLRRQGLRGPAQYRPWRVPHVRRRRHVAVRGQGARAAQPCRQLFQRQPEERADHVDDLADRAHGRDRDALGSRGAAAGKPADQVAVAALQRLAARRQDLSPCAADPRGLAAHRAASRPARHSRPLLRAVSRRYRRARNAEPDAQAVQAAQLRGQRVPQPLAAVPAVPDRSLQRALRGAGAGAGLR